MTSSSIFYFIKSDGIRVRHGMGSCKGCYCIPCSKSRVLINKRDI